MRVCHQCGASAKAEGRFCASCGATLSGAEGSSGATDPLIGRTIGGSYILQEIVGVGGMGRVYRAEQSVLGRTVAVKVIHPHLLGDEQTVARFYTEARAASRLNHPNSVGIIDFGRTDDGILFLAMEFIKGQDLAIVMHEDGPLPFKRICDVLIAVLDALGEAAPLGVVHRDLKPENIILKQMRSGQDLVKVVDFGLATIVGGGSTSITRPGLVCGTPDYMAPEQARGEAVDTRGDIYSLGVALFELLTERLPYIDETPTKVVLRHINDPIPDPRQVAPHRGIPPKLAEITVRALAKSASDRFQTPQEMQVALREALAELRTGGKGNTLACPGCGQPNPAAMRFCGSCGTRLTGIFPVHTPAPRSGKPSFYPSSGQRRLFVGREIEVARVDEVRQQAGVTVAWAHLVGEVGVGRTRMLMHLADRYGEAGDKVVGSGAHPSGALVPYGPLRRILADLLEVPLADLGKMVRQELSFADALSQAGVSEILQPRGLAGTEGRDRAGAVGAALETAARVALGRGGAPRAVLIIDDLDKADDLTRAALTSLLAGHSQLPVLILTSGTGRVAAGIPAETIELPGLDLDEASRFLSAHADPGDDVPLLPPGYDRRHLPLYLEQLQAVGGAPEDSLPPRLADMVLQRLERLPLAARRVLQATAVLGDRCELERLSQVLGGGAVEGLDMLAKAGLAQLVGTMVEICHPFVRELVEASIPAEARKALHQRALDVLTQEDAPLEVRAEHGYRAGDPLSALMLLERMGDVALQRGDPQAAVLAFRRALEMARREMLESGDTMMDTAIMTFSRKLGEALGRAGEVARADGVLREALDLTGPASPDRGKLLLALGRVAHRRDRRRDAIRLYGQALERVGDGRDARVEAATQLAIGQTRLADGDGEGAAVAYGRSLDLMQSLDFPKLQQAQTWLDLARAFAIAGRTGQAEEAIGRCEALATGSEVPALLAEARGLLADLRRAGGHAADAARLYHEATTLATEAGDVEAMRRYREAKARTDTPPAG